MRNASSDPVRDLGPSCRDPRPGYRFRPAYSGTTRTYFVEYAVRKLRAPPPFPALRRTDCYRGRSGPTEGICARHIGFRQARLVRPPLRSHRSCRGRPTPVPASNSITKPKAVRTRSSSISPRAATFHGSNPSSVPAWPRRIPRLHPRTATPRAVPPSPSCPSPITAPIATRSTSATA